MVSCIDIEIKRVGQEFEFNAERSGRIPSFEIKRVGQEFEFNAERSGRIPSFEIKRVGQEFDFKCGLVCSVGSEFYLRVPQEHIWLLPENDFSEDMVVYSNVSWTIE